MKTIMRTTNDNIMKFLSHNVLYLRTKNDITKKEMAKILGIGITTLNKIEQGVLPPRLSVEMLFRIRDYFGVSLSLLVSANLGERIV